MRKGQSGCFFRSWFPLSCFSESRPVPISTEQISRGEHSPGLEAAVTVDDQGIPLDLDLLHERHPRVLEIPELVLRLLRFELNLPERFFQLADFLDKPKGRKSTITSTHKKITGFVQRFHVQLSFVEQESFHVSKRILFYLNFSDMLTWGLI